MAKQARILTGRFDKFIHGGQALGQTEEGKNALVWGVMPGESAEFEVSRSRSSYVEGVVSKVLEPSEYRVPPKDDNYLSTSPWQVLDESQEDIQKSEILKETLMRGSLGDLDVVGQKTDNFWNYRNKMEFSFFGDESGLHLALFNRGTHRKQPTLGSSIAQEPINSAARDICRALEQKSVRAGDLKSLILRCSQEGQVVAALFVKDENFPVLEELGNLCKGLIVVYSHPKSPASVRTKDLHVYGDISLSDQILGKKVSYDVFSFFQVNIPVFETAVGDIKAFIDGDRAIDLYSGVGSIGLCVPSVYALVESDPANIIWAKFNSASNPSLKVIGGPAEAVPDHLSSDSAVILDPPRAGLHANLIEDILAVLPPKIAYLSCNPSTQARDVALLQSAYDIDVVKCYNFFPRTPHIESLITLTKKQDIKHG